MPQSLSSLFGKTLTSSSGINTVANIVTSSATFGDTAILPQNDNKMQVIGNAYISGNLGIGTTATVKLDVAGNARVSGIITASGGIVVGSATSQSVFITSAGFVGLGSTAPRVSLDASQETDAIALPQGTTAQRPTGNNPYIRYNTTNSALEFYNGTDWVEIISDYFPTGSVILG